MGADMSRYIPPHFQLTELTVACHLHEDDPGEGRGAEARLSIPHATVCLLLYLEEKRVGSTLLHLLFPFSHRYRRQLSVYILAPG